MDGGATPGWAAGETPAVGAAGQKQRSRWDETPAAGSAIAGGATPGLGATPAWGGATPAFGVTPVGGMGMETPDVNQLPKVHLPSVNVPLSHARCSAGPALPLLCMLAACRCGRDLSCSSSLQVPLSAEQYQMARWEREMDERNRPLTDEELDAIIPKEGYRTMPEPPVSHYDCCAPVAARSAWFCAACSKHLQCRVI